jgi:hypothetical protein
MDLKPETNPAAIEQFVRENSKKTLITEMDTGPEQKKTKPNITRVEIGSKLCLSVCFAFLH